ncbi:MAG: flagellar basal body P-ring formation protein FlgA [Bacteroidetes bacterium]|nr:flagellar basal body P-ring formation protein FlgA [Bacteroidota bacterium]MCW5895087.1 flagellar basal body P-ring formation protein FlgA [Bacteroidota bacterium]
MIEQFIGSKLAAQSSAEVEFAVEFRKVPVNGSVTLKGATFRVADKGSMLLRKNVLLPIEVVQNGRVEHTFLVSVKIRRFGKVMIASDKIEKGQSGDSIAARREEVETTMLSEDVITDPKKLVGKRAKRIINAGSVLTESMFEGIPTITQGSPVTLSVKSNSIVIGVQAIAREDGAKGDIIKVQKTGSGNRFTARVVDEKNVELVSHK